MSYQQHRIKFVVPALLLLLFSGLFSAVASAQQKSMPPKTQDRPLDSRIASMERPERDAWQKPDEVVKALDLKNGEVVADIGAGTGYFTRRFAKAVAPDGKVYAVDIAADVLGYLKDRAAKENLPNIVIDISKPDDPLLPGNTIDLAFICDTTHHMENRATYYRTLAPALKKHGRLAIIDYPPGSPHAPHPPDQLVPRSQVIDEAEQGGFKYVREFRFLPYHYFLIFEKK